MMDMKQLTPDLSVGPQIQVDDVAELARRGFKAIIGNRPDNEGPDQPRWEELAFLARSHGLEARHIPVVPGHLGDEEIAAFRQALSELPKPVAAFCKTGTRSTMLWALVNPQELSADDRIGQAAAQSYDISALRPRLDPAT